jgi:hypothetical protein
MRRRISAVYDHELDRFKRDIHLVQYATERYGYARDPRESSRHSHVLRRESDNDKLVVRRGADGHWTYFSVRDGRDSGTVVDFVQKRGHRSLGDVRQELRRWLGVTRPEFEATQWARREAPTGDRRGPAEAFAAASVVASSPYLNARGIRPETLQGDRFAGTWRQDARNNVLFVHRDDAGVVTGFEVKNRGFTGFAAGGTKTAWRSSARPDDRALVVTESAIDALSHHQLHRDKSDSTRYVSTAGAPSTRQVEILDKAITALPAGRIVAATDADQAGTDLAQRIRELASRHPQVTFERHAPTVGKDWNDVLKRVERDYIRSLPLAVRALGLTRDRGR